MLCLALTIFMSGNKPKLLFFVTEDWYFCSHRLALAKAAQDAGFNVSVLTRVNEDGETIQNAGITLIPLELERGGHNPFRELRTLVQVAMVYRRLKPDLVHHIALKPILYGGLVSLAMPNLKVINLLAGLGTVFSTDHPKTRFLRSLVQRLFVVLFGRRNTVTIVQNNEDYGLLLQQLGIPDSKLRLIKGSGVDIEKFYSVSEPLPPIRIGMVSRLLWDKGVGEYVAAMRMLKQKGFVFDAMLVGMPDDENMSSITQQQMHEWEEEGVVSCLGHLNTISAFWQNTHIAVLPSYREGLPRCLLEAAASGRPIVTTDTSGCREVVEHGVNGLLVPLRDVDDLANAVEQLILNQALRIKMGEAGRRKVEQEFSDAVVLAQTLDVYRELA
jgi:glycosyltransferase involved in cell wall biosynthesis